MSTRRNTRRYICLDKSQHWQHWLHRLYHTRVFYIIRNRNSIFCNDIGFFVQRHDLFIQIPIYIFASLVILCDYANCLSVISEWCCEMGWSPSTKTRVSDSIHVFSIFNLLQSGTFIMIIIRMYRRRLCYYVRQTFFSERHVCWTRCTVAKLVLNNYLSNKKKRTNRLTKTNKKRCESRSSFWEFQLLTLFLTHFILTPTWRFCAWIVYNNCFSFFDMSITFKRQNKN